MAQLDAAIHDIAQHVETIALMTDENTTASDSNCATARLLDELSSTLEGSVNRHKTEALIRAKRRSDRPLPSPALPHRVAFFNAE
ncbi:hypothetical protein [Propionivibrio dicarboxylicus]|uniref:hypothetical protein n=1 Tax=Propionivibrio dicarboxylicus TaxID=83767 RepID=UPI000B85166A|nr:hypothetical protein [Propionivibrio dicarboxylicus]